MQARYVILRVLLEAGEKLVQLTSVTGSDGKPDVLISLDRTKIESVGRPAIGNFLRKLQVYHHLCDLGLVCCTYLDRRSINILVFCARCTNQRQITILERFCMIAIQQLTMNF